MDAPSPCTQLVITHIFCLRAYDFSPGRSRRGLRDQRRTRRSVAYAAAAAAGPSRSVPRQCDGRWKQTKGAYRLFDQAEVTLDRLQEPHRRLTLQEASGRQAVLWISDTTTLSFDHPATEGLGVTSTGGQGQGM